MILIDINCLDIRKIQIRSRDRRRSITGTEWSPCSPRPWFLFREVTGTPINELGDC